MESGKKDASAWISNNDIKNYLKSDAIKAKHILLISDSCFSGDFFRGHRGRLPEVTNETIRRSYELTSRQAITSGGLEPVSDSGFSNNSVFTHFFVKALEQNEKPFLVPSAFFPDIKAGVAENAEQFPQFGSLHNTGGQQGGEFVFFLKQGAILENLSDIEAQKQKEYERLLKMEHEASAAQQREAMEIAQKEKELEKLEKKIEAMNKRLGTSEVRVDDSLDAMLAMVRQKKEQAARLAMLRQQKQEEQRKREEEIARLKKEREAKIIASLEPEVAKYKEIVNSQYGKSLKSSAWQALIAKCPPGWADGVEIGDYQMLLKNDNQRLQLLSERETIDERKRKKREKLESLKRAAGRGSTIKSSNTSIKFPGGVWEGTLKIYRPKQKKWSNFNVSVNFPAMIVNSNFCWGYGNSGRITDKSENIFKVDWPKCGMEKVSFSISGQTLQGKGESRAYSDGRINKDRIWNLRKQ